MTEAAKNHPKFSLLDLFLNPQSYFSPHVKFFSHKMTFTSILVLHDQKKTLFAKKKKVQKV